MDAETIRAKQGGAFAVLAFAAIVLVTLALGATAPARAQNPAPGDGGPASSLTASEVESLVETLRDDAAREELLRTLETLVEARRAGTTDTPSSETGNVGGTVLAFLSRRVEALGTVSPKRSSLASARSRTRSSRSSSDCSSSRWSSCSCCRTGSRCADG